RDESLFRHDVQDCGSGERHHAHGQLAAVSRHRHEHGSGGVSVRRSHRDRGEYRHAASADLRQWAYLPRRSRERRSALRGGIWYLSALKERRPMLTTLIEILVTIGIIALIAWLIETYFPALPKIWRAIIVASLVLAAIRALHTWVCGWLCA